MTKTGVGVNSPHYLKCTSNNLKMWKATCKGTGIEVNDIVCSLQISCVVSGGTGQRRSRVEDIRYTINMGNWV